MSKEFNEVPKAILFRCTECNELKDAREAQAVEVAESWVVAHRGMPSPLFDGKYICKSCLDEAMDTRERPTWFFDELMRAQSVGIVQQVSIEGNYVNFRLDMSKIVIKPRCE